MNDLYYRDERTELRVGDALEVIRSLPASSMDCVVTSPPHWGLRDYGTAEWTGGNPECHHTLGTTPHQRRTIKKRPAIGTRTDVNKRCRMCGAISHDRQYGLEPTIGEYIHRIREVGSEIWRLLTPRGTFWLNLRDTFSFQNGGTGRVFTGEPSSGAVRHKSLIGVPWRVVLGLQSDGWIVRNAIVWDKPNAIPDPASDRFSTRYEMLFLLVKQPAYHFDTKAVRVPYSTDRPPQRKTHYGGKKPHTVKTSWQLPKGLGKNPGDVWAISTRPLPDAHCAAFPVDLPLRCIAAGCPVDGTVLDPFSGAGTTGLAARRLGRRYLGAST